MSVFNEKLRTLLANREWTHSKLAAVMHVSPSAVQKWVVGKNMPDAETVIMPDFARTILEKYTGLLLDRINEAVGKGLYLATIEAIMGGFPTVSMMIGLRKHFKRVQEIRTDRDESTEL